MSTFETVLIIVIAVLSILYLIINYKIFRIKQDIKNYFRENGITDEDILEEMWNVTLNEARKRYKNKNKKS